VIGLAPSATAAQELSAAVGIACETTAKWQHETEQSGSAAPSRQGCGNLYRLRAGQLVIVDEASLAATLTVDQLTAQAVAAGAKVLLVGDHHQLAAINAGGAFGLLARDTNPVELSLLWRFRNRWEARASRGLRAADNRVLDDYAAHGRILDGPEEAMVEEAYQAWYQSLANGAHAVLIAADNKTVAALNARAQADRIAAGRLNITGVAGVDLHDDTRAGIGDQVVTRHNDRRLQTAHQQWVRNGDLWTIHQIHTDRSVTVHRMSAGNRTDTVRLPAPYVREHLELGYATTVHRAQGLTADTAFVLVRPGMSREALYVAMTRGRDANYAYVATDLPDPRPPTPNRHGPAANRAPSARRRTRPK
jgi:ATP-dependent exoDNAse (exonuclease V) alpha subunit